MNRRGPLASFVAPVFLVLIFLYHVLATARWLEGNPLPNGYQNEILHLSNALDLFVVMQFKNTDLIHSFLFKGYWPPLVYLLSLIPVGIIGPSRDAFVAVNGLFLMLLFGGTWRITRRLFDAQAALVAVALVGFFPSIYGNLVRFEPNVPLAAVVTLGCYALIRTEDFSRLRWSIVFGLVSGAGLLVDRLAFLFFLWAPALFSFARGLKGGYRSKVRRRALVRHGLWAIAGFLLVAGYYHSFFFAIHWEEIFSQAGTGEIIETGEQTEFRDPWSVLTWLFYPLTVMDSQVGPALTLALLPAMFLGSLKAWKRKDGKLVLLWLGGALLFFSLVQKKQVFYTIPILPTLAILSAGGLWSIRWRGVRYPYLALIGILGLNQHYSLMTNEPFLPEGVVGRGAVVAGMVAGHSPLPDSWVAPRYPQARPPDENFLLPDDILAIAEELRGGLPVFRIGLYSEDPVLFEGYLHFFVRAGFPYIRVNGLVSNIQAFYEWTTMMDLFIYATDGAGPPWPQAERVDETLESFHRQNMAFPAAKLLEAVEEDFTLQRTLLLSSGATVYFYTPPIAQEKAPEELLIEDDSTGGSILEDVIPLEDVLPL